jgi:hypothetical protein
MRTRRIEFKHPGYDPGIIRVNFDGSFGFVIPVAQRGMTGIDALRSLLPHPLLHFLAQVF